MPAAYLTTPAGTLAFDQHMMLIAFLQCPSLNIIDVVKTRLQVEARKGQTHYAGLRDAFVKICMWFESVLSVTLSYHPNQTGKKASEPSSKGDLLVLSVAVHSSDSRS